MTSLCTLQKYARLSFLVIKQLDGRIKTVTALGELDLYTSVCRKPTSDNLPLSAIAVFYSFWLALCRVFHLPSLHTISIPYPDSQCSTKNKNNIANKFSLELDCNYFSCMFQSNFYLCENEAEKEFCGENNNKSQSVITSIVEVC